MEDIKPCPVCNGNDIELVEEPYTYDHGAYTIIYYIKCNSCKIYSGLADDFIEGIENTKEKTIMHWNALKRS